MTSSTTPPSRSDNPAYPNVVSASDARQDSKRYSLSTGGLDPRKQYGRLADPCLPVEQNRARKLVAGVEEPLDRSELVLSADQLRGPRRARRAVSCAAVAYEFKLPDLGEGLTEAEIARWLVAEGQSVEEDEPLVEVQTDKTTVEIPSPRAGTVLKILVEEGEIAPVGAVLVVIGEEGEQLLRAVERARHPRRRRAGGAARRRRPARAGRRRAGHACRAAAGERARRRPRRRPPDRSGRADPGVGRPRVRGGVRRRASRPDPRDPPRDRRAGLARPPRDPGGHVRRGVRLHRRRRLAARAARGPRLGAGARRAPRAERAARGRRHRPLRPRRRRHRGADRRRPRRAGRPCLRASVRRGDRARGDPSRRGRTCGHARGGGAPGLHVHRHERRQARRAPRHAARSTTPRSRSSASIASQSARSSATARSSPAAWGTCRSRSTTVPSTASSQPPSAWT